MMIWCEWASIYEEWTISRPGSAQFSLSSDNLMSKTMMRRPMIICIPHQERGMSWGVESRNVCEARRLIMMMMRLLCGGLGPWRTDRTNKNKHIKRLVKRPKMKCLDILKRRERWCQAWISSASRSHQCLECVKQNFNLHPHMAHTEYIEHYALYDEVTDVCGFPESGTHRSYVLPKTALTFSMLSFRLLHSQHQPYCAQIGCDIRNSL